MIRMVAVSTVMAMGLLLNAATAQSAAPVCGDVNTSGTLTSGDALLVLKGAVGQSVILECPANDELIVCQTALDACESGSGGGGGLPATGQTTCYDFEGSVVACDGSGQDGDFKAGVARSFTDNDDGTVTDNATGLTWEKLDDAGGLHDKDAFFTLDVAIAAKIDELNFQQIGGHADWRLPNRWELESIANLQAFGPATFTAFNNGCSTGCTTLECSCTRPDTYWTSTSYHHLPSVAWTINFSDGFVATANKTLPQYVRAVRGGIVAP